MSKPQRTPPPRHLEAEGRRLWTALLSEFAFPDVASQELLTRACEAADRAAQAREIIKRDGILTSSGARHPAVVIERDAMNSQIQAFKLLGLSHDWQGSGRRPGT